MLNYLSVSEIAKLWEISERSVRNYCAIGKISNAVLVGKTWKIPENAVNPSKKKYPEIIFSDILSKEKKSKIKDGIYVKLQVDFTYNSNRMEDNVLTYNDVLYMLECNKINSTVDMCVDNIVETANHFKCVDMCIKNAKHQLSENFIRQLFLTLKNGTMVSRDETYMTESYKKFPEKIKSLIEKYNSLETVELKDILIFQSNCFR